MDTNNTLFNGTGDLSDGPAVPLYVTFSYTSILSMMAISITTPAVMVIRVILNNPALKTKNNIFLVNLLVADVCAILIRWMANVILTIFYLLDASMNVNCTIILVPSVVSLLATKIMFLPLSVDRFIHVAFPFSYKSIMTTRVVAIIISSLWLSLSLVSFILLVNQPKDYIPSLGTCRPSTVGPVLNLFTSGSIITSIILITITSIYLRYRIIKSNRFFHSVKRSAAEEQKSIKAGRLVEILKEQIKPTMSVFIAGGIDGALNVVFIIITIILTFFNVSHMAFLYIFLFGQLPLQLSQAISHVLCYGLRNKEIRKRLAKSYGCSKFFATKRSKVVTLDGGRQH